MIRLCDLLLTWPMAKLEKLFWDYIFSRKNKV